MILAYTFNDHDDTRDVKVSLYVVYDVTCHTEKFTGWFLMILIVWVFSIILTLDPSLKYQLRNVNR